MSNNNADEVKVQGGGIAERLAALKKNGEEGWKKKVAKVEIPTIVNNKLENNGNSTDNHNNEDDNMVQLRKPDIPVGKIQERLSQLQTAQNSWQEKVGEKDVAKFTVAGKMGTPILAAPNPLPRRVSRRETDEMNAVNDKLSKRVKSTPKMRRFHGSPPPANDKSYDEPAASEAADFEAIYSKTVEFHSLDEDLDKFFSKAAINSADDTAFAADMDFETVENESMLLNNTRRPKKPLNHKRRSRNPIKALAQRTDLKSSYNQKPSKSELKAVVILEDKKDVHAHLASEAKAGLAATEDFSNINLKKDNTFVPHAEFVPYKAPGETMLIQIKGRRMCQPRLVEPVAESINSGDAYVALNGLDVVVWQGQFCNVIEKSKSADVGAFIVQKRDLGCKKARRVVMVEEDKVSEANIGSKLFWKMLGSSRPLKAEKAGPPDEDENYEVEVNDRNLVWSVNPETSELIPIEEYWGQPLRHEVLENDLRVLVFDFGSEVYVWNGKNAAFPTRRLGLKLAKDMLAEEKRPEWTLFGRINQNMETILFREKFLNWPDESRLIKPEKESKKARKTVHDEDNLKLSTEVENNFDAIDMARWPLQEPNYELEGAFIGRGRSYYDPEERRQYEIETLQLNFWHVTDKDILELSEKDHGQFHSGATYVVRWKYKVSLTGKTLKGLPSKHVAVGRERWAYFFWHGSESKAAEQGLSALMTVELDEEKGPQIRVEEGQEHAVFLNLWKGGMAIHKGRRDGQKGQKRLYFVKGEYPEEACAVQVDCKEDSLRSRGCFVLFNGAKATIWLGKGLPEHKKAVVDSLRENWCDLKTAAGIAIEHEGQESEAFKTALAFGNEDGLYYSNLTAPNSSMRLYQMTSVSGEFEVHEVVCPFLNSEKANVMSFNQADLYKAEQPALFLVESGNEKLWLWQGWWPDVGHESNDTNMTTGSGMIRWHAERREAMRTIKEFQRSKFSRMNQRPPMELVWAGHEPEEFTNLFPSWRPRPEIGCLNSKFVGDSSLDRVFALLGRDSYSWEELQQRPFPDGVDPSRLEKYLSDDDFVKYLGLSRADFMAAPRWKQLEIRKEKGLF